MTHLFTVGLTTVLVATVTPAIGSHASANNWFGATGAINSCGANGNRTDAAPMSFFYSDTTARITDAGEFVRKNRIQGATDLGTRIHTQQVAKTDVVVLDRYYVDYCGIEWTSRNSLGQVTGYVLGMSMCRRLTANNRCDSSDVRINLTAADQASRGQLRGSFLCHEIGHSIGLKHRVGGSDGCLEIGAHDHTDYTPHDRDHINSAF